MSFLNVGSGTGYFSSIVSELIGEFAISDGVDIWPETVAFAADNCRQAGKNNIHFTVGNVYQLDVNQGTLYDRIYLGACGSVHSVYLYKLLQVGGILVGPFETGTGQHLRRVVRRSDTRFDVEVISSVRFASLVEPPQSVSSSCLPGRATPTTQREQSRVCQSCAGLPGVPFTFALRELPWTSARHRAYPASFRGVVAAVVFGRPSNLRSAALTIEIWTLHIFPFCSRQWFDELPAAPPPSALARLAAAGEAARSAVMLPIRKARVRLESGFSDGSGGSTRASSAGSEIADFGDASPPWALLLPEGRSGPRRQPSRSNFVLRWLGCGAPLETGESDTELGGGRVRGHGRGIPAIMRRVAGCLCPPRWCAFWTQSA
jgi:SAM-dependent methyltransferase